MKHKFKSIDGAVRRIRCLEKVLASYEQHAQQRENQLRLLARLASDTPAFYNPFEVIAAKKLRDDILARPQQ